VPWSSLRCAWREGGLLGRRAGGARARAAHWRVPGALGRAGGGRGRRGGARAQPGRARRRRACVQRGPVRACASLYARCSVSPGRQLAARGALVQLHTSAGHATFVTRAEKVLDLQRHCGEWACVRQSVTCHAASLRLLRPGEGARSRQAGPAALAGCIALQQLPARATKPGQYDGHAQHAWITHDAHCWCGAVLTRRGTCAGRVRRAAQQDTARALDTPRRSYPGARPSGGGGLGRASPAAPSAPLLPRGAPAPALTHGLLRDMYDATGSSSPGAPPALPTLTLPYPFQPARRC